MTPNHNILNMNQIKKKQKKDKKEEEEKPFEFKSIPKEIENKYIGNDKKEENKVYDELNDFMGKGKDNKSKVELIKENIPLILNIILKINFLFQIIMKNLSKK